MKKTFCDYCENEITNANAVPGQIKVRLRKNDRELRLKILVANDAPFAGCDACIDCVMEAAKQPPMNASSEDDGAGKPKRSAVSDEPRRESR